MNISTEDLQMATSLLTPTTLSQEIPEGILGKDYIRFHGFNVVPNFEPSRFVVVVEHWRQQLVNHGWEYQATCSDYPSLRLFDLYTRGTRGSEVLAIYDQPHASLAFAEESSPTSKRALAALQDLFLVWYAKDVFSFGYVVGFWPLMHDNWIRAKPFAKLASYYDVDYVDFCGVVALAKKYSMKVPEFCKIVLQKCGDSFRNER